MSISVVNYEKWYEVIQGDLTAEEAETLKAKHIQLTLENQSYKHCMEVIELKEEDTDHYDCYNEEQEILNHIVIIGEAYIEKISSL